MENGFKDARKFYHKQEEEEMCHADMLTEYLLTWDSGEDLPPLEQTEDTCDKLSDTIKIALNMEESLLKQYQSDIEETFNSQDIVTSDFLRTFLQIQLESVKCYREKMKLIKQMGGEENENEVEKALFGYNNQIIAINS